MIQIPTRQDRIETMYGEQLKAISGGINDAILTGYEHTCNKGYPYFHADVNHGEYIHSELFNWLKERYKEGGWLLERHGHDDEPCSLRIFRYKKDEE